MILVDIYVPSVDNVYDFQLDERTPVVTIIEEIGELVEQKEHCAISGQMNDLLLCTRKDKRILPKDATLNECNVRTGDSLILV